MSGNDNTHCMLADATVFIGMTSLPMAGAIDFFKKELKPFFHDYRDKFITVPEEQRDEYNKCFYNPSAYVMLGPFDLAVLALLDEYRFPIQRFYSNSPGLHASGAQDQPPRAFAHRTILGPCPRGNPDECVEGTTKFKPDPYARRVVGLARDTFLCLNSEQPKYPLLGICQVEVNTSFLIGGGGDFLRCLVRAIKTKLDSFKKTNSVHMELIIVEGFSWHELTLLVFARSYESIYRFVHGLREMDLLELGLTLFDEDGSSCNDDEAKKKMCDSYRKDWQRLLGNGNLFELEEDVRAWQSGDAMLVDFLRGPDRKGVWFSSKTEGDRRRVIAECRDISPFGTHVFFNTSTTIGFALGILDDLLPTLTEARRDNPDANLPELIREVLTRTRKDGGVWQVDDKDKVCFVRRWSTKAGHDYRAASTLNSGRKEDYLLAIGRADLVYPCSTAEQPDQESKREATGGAKFRYTDSCGVVSEVVLQVLALTTDGDVANELAAGIVSVHTTVAVLPLRDQSTGSLPKGHTSASATRERFALTARKIGDIREKLRTLHLPKVTELRVHNALALYNDGVRDNFLFSSFLELRPYIDRLVNYLLEPWDSKVADGGSGRKNDRYPRMIRDVDTLVTNFEAGWRNRFHGGWRLGEISDFNLEFKGGIQQLVTAFDGAYKRLSWLFTGRRDVLALATGSPTIFERAGTCHFNLHDLTQPEFFALHVGHEASEPALVDLDAAKIKTSWADALGRCQRYRTKLRDRVEREYLMRSNRELFRDLPLMAALFRNSRDFFDQVFADVCGYRTMFGVSTLAGGLSAEQQLYSYWTLAGFLSEPENWKSPYQVNGERLLGFLLRTFLAMCAYPESGTAPDRRDVLEDIGRYWGRLLNSNYVPYEACRQAVRFLDPDCSPARDPFHASILADVVAVADKDRRGEFVKEMRSRSSTAKELLAKGQVYAGESSRSLLGAAEFKPDDHDAYRRRAVFDTIAVLRAYLELVKERSGVDDAVSNGRNRLSQQLTGVLRAGGPPIRLANWRRILGINEKRLLVSRSGDPKWEIVGPDPAADASLLFEPRGGTSCWDPAFRRKLLMWRSTLVMSLLDIAEKTKLAYCKEWFDRH